MEKIIESINGKRDELVKIIISKNLYDKVCRNCEYPNEFFINSCRELIDKIKNQS